MSNLLEGVMTSDASGQLWTSCVWDPRAGTSVMAYKGGGVSASKALCMLGKDYVISAESKKPLLHVWPVNSQETTHKGLRLVVPGQVSALAASPDGFYYVAGIEEKVHVWQVACRKRSSVATRHFQKITCIRFSDDSCHFATGGEDGMVMVWSVSRLVCILTGSSAEPSRIFSAHSMPVQDLFMGRLGMRARLATVSSDKLCKLYDVLSSSLLFAVLFDYGLTAVTMDVTESNIFVGSTVGNIHQFSLRQFPRKRIQEYVDSSDIETLKFVGHTKAVTCLSISLDGLTLLSGSEDERVLLWHIPSRQCIRVLPHKGPITNAFFFITPKQMFANELDPMVIWAQLQEEIELESDEDEGDIVHVMTREDLSRYTIGNRVESDTNQMFPGHTQDTKVKEERDKYKKVNHDLYEFAVSSILDNVHPETDIGKDCKTSVNGNDEQTLNSDGKAMNSDGETLNSEASVPPATNESKKLLSPQPLPTATNTGPVSCKSTLNSDGETLISQEETINSEASVPPATNESEKLLSPQPLPTNTVLASYKSTKKIKNKRNKLPRI